MDRKDRNGLLRSHDGLVQNTCRRIVAFFLVEVTRIRGIFEMS